MRVLIAEDEPVVAEALKERLEALEHIVAGMAYDGRDAVAQADAVAPDLIFLDVKMPHLDGIQAVAAIMARRPVPIIVLTAHADPAVIERALAEGVMGYLVKPVKQKDLEPAIAVAVSRFADLLALRRDVRSLKDAIALRQQVQRARGVLMGRLGVSEAAAHRHLQRFAEREQITVAKAATQVITADEFFASLEE